jgi:lysophospholipase L1-like esterase
MLDKRMVKVFLDNLNSLTIDSRLPTADSGTITMIRTSIILFLLLAINVNVYAQTSPPFWNDIVAFQKKDAQQKPVKGGILFTGSSSFTRWYDVQSAFPGYPIINRGFGGSTLVDVIRYAYDVILPYAPKQVIIYCGENDLASADSIQVTEVVKRYKTLFGIIRQNLPGTTIDFVSIKPSPVRASIQTKVIAANKEIRKFISRQKNARFIDIYAAMLDKNGNMREELYVEDRLHMKPEGYRIWQKIIHPYLLTSL